MSATAEAQVNGHELIQEVLKAYPEKTAKNARNILTHEEGN